MNEPSTPDKSKSAKPFLALAVPPLLSMLIPLLPGGLNSEPAFFLFLLIGVGGSLAAGSVAAMRLMQGSRLGGTAKLLCGVALAAILAVASLVCCFAGCAAGNGFAEGLK